MRFKIFLIAIAFYGLHINAIAQKNDQLEEAYLKNSTKKLKDFFDRWASEIKPISDKELLDQNDLVKHSYAIFEVLFNPHEIGKLGVKQERYELYRNYSYFIIPLTVRLFSADKVYFNEHETDLYTIESIKKNVPPKMDSLVAKFVLRVQEHSDTIIFDAYGPYSAFYNDTSKKYLKTITDFRPRVTQVTGKPLYLTEKRESELKNFLGNEYIPFGTGGARNIAQAKGSSKLRMEFLEKYVKIAHGHWGGNWELTTPPIITDITFDKECKYVAVDYMLMYEAGRAFLRFTDGKWELLSAKRVWQQ